MDIQKEREAFEAWHYEQYLLENPNIDISNAKYIYDYAHKNALVYQLKESHFTAWQAAKAQAVPEGKGRSDFEIIDQTIELVDLIASSNRFQRDKSKPFPFESNNPRNIEWWRLACQIQELLTDTDPNNCDFEEYKAMIAAREPAND